jgi:hypothetical protein
VPELLAAQAMASGVTGWSGVVETREAGGLLYAYASGNDTESATTIRTRGRALAVVAPGPQAVMGDGLPPGRQARVHFLHDTGTGQSTVLSSAPFETPSAEAGAGTLRIAILKRGQHEIAPEAVFFRASVTAPGLREAPDRGDYDESFHKALYVWDFGDPGAASDKVVNLPAAHNDLNRAYGKEVAHVFTTPGGYAVTCTAYDADGVLIGSDRVTLQVRDPAAIFEGERTILIDPDGRGDPARYPEAQVVRDWDTAWQARRDLGEETTGRILLPRGSVTRLTEQLTLNWHYANVHVSAWGTGPRPVLETAGPDLIYCNHQCGRDVVFQGIAFRGPWDSTTETGRHAVGFATEQENDRAVVLDDCTFSGFGLSVFVIDEWDQRFASMFVLHNCDVTNWGDYGAYFGTNADQFIAFLGTAIHQDTHAMMGGGGRKAADRNQHGPIRLANGGHTHISVCDLFSRNGWSDAGGVAADQPCLRWASSAAQQSEARSSCNLERSALEGGFLLVSIDNAGSGGPSYGTNFVMDKCLLVGSARTFMGVLIQYTGVTLRNSIMVRPRTAMISNRWRGWVIRADVPDDIGAPNDPVEVYGNTMVNLLDDAQRGPADLVLDKDIEGFERFSFENNVAFAPNATGQQPEDPRLSTAPMPTAGGAWAARYLGPRHRGLSGNGAQLTLDTTFATPPETVGTYRPLPGSPVIDSSSGRVPVDDFFGRMRSDMPERGAIET